MVFTPPPPDSGSLASSSTCTMPTRFISYIRVVYNRNEPDGAVGELNGKGNNINQGFDGESVWLVPGYTSAPGAAYTSFDIWIQNWNTGGYPNLAKGDGGDYRYLVPITSPTHKNKATEMQLLRSTTPVLQAPTGYSRISRNINEGRGGDYVYIVWKTWTFEPCPIPDGVYIIRNKATNTVIDLYAGQKENGTPISCYGPVPRSKYYFNQNWWIENVKGSSRYRIKNVRTNTCIEIKDGSPDNRARVQGHQANEEWAQEWYIQGNDQTGYSFFNASAETVLDLSGSLGTEANPVIGFRSHGGDNQLWFLDSRSFHSRNIATILDSGQYTSNRFRHINNDRVYMLCPEEIIIHIWNECKSSNRRRRNEYSSDDLAFAMKVAVNDWAYDNILAPVRLLFGVIFCKEGKIQHAYNWCLNQDLTSAAFFDPQTGRMVTLPEYEAYSGVY